VKSYKYRIYPTIKQSKMLEETLANCQRLYNVALEHKREVYRITKKNISCNEQQKELSSIRKTFPEYSKIHSQVLQNVFVRVDLAFEGFFRRIKISNKQCGFPRFKSKDSYNSFCFPQSGFAIKNNKVEISKIGLIKTKFHRSIPVDNKIKTCTIKKEGSLWHIIFVCETPKIIKQEASSCNAIGIDLGLTDFAVLSNGEKISNPKYLKKSEIKLKKIQREYSKKRNKKNKHKLQNIHKKIANQRKDFQHKLSRKLVNSFNFIIYEDLTIKKMIENNKYNLQKHIHDASWRTFILMLKYKAENAGTYTIAINPKGTTQQCSSCNSVTTKSLNVRLHNCTYCGFVANRDYNAALNIHKLGINFFDNYFLSSKASMPLGSTQFTH